MVSQLGGEVCDQFYLYPDDCAVVLVSGIGVWIGFMPQRWSDSNRMLSSASVEDLKNENDNKEIAFSCGF